MIHYVLLKFAPGTDLDAAEATVCETYAALDQALDYFHEPAVFRSCVERDSNADIMARVRLDTKEQLQHYLTHPLHVQMAQQLGASVVARTSFDHM